MEEGWAEVQRCLPLVARCLLRLMHTPRCGTMALLWAERLKRQLCWRVRQAAIAAGVADPKPFLTRLDGLRALHGILRRVITEGSDWLQAMVGAALGGVPVVGGALTQLAQGLLRGAVQTTLDVLEEQATLAAQRFATLDEKAMGTNMFDDLLRLVSLSACMQMRPLSVSADAENARSLEQNLHHQLEGSVVPTEQHKEETMRLLPVEEEEE